MSPTTNQQDTRTTAPVLLPFELEKIIFEDAARERISIGGGFLNILLVCNYVKEWIEAIIYESLIVEAPLVTARLLLRTLASKAQRHDQFLQRTVKRLYLGPIVSAEEASFVLSMCTGATEVVSWAPEASTGVVLEHLRHNLALERLAVRSNDIFRQPNMDNICASYSSPRPCSSSTLLLGQILSNITHLCIISPSEPRNLTTTGANSEGVYSTDYDALLYMSSLTYVVFGKLWIRPHKSLFPFFSRMLSRPSESFAGREPQNRLQSLVLISSEAAFVNQAKKWHQDEMSSDSRLTIGKEYDYGRMSRLGWVHKK